MNQPFDWKQVPGFFDFDDVYEWAVDRAPRAGARHVEVGVLLGRSALFMVDAVRQSGKQIQLDAVDVFRMELPRLEARIETHRARNPDDDHSRLDEIHDLFRELGHHGAVRRIIELGDPGKIARVVRSSGQLWAPQYPAESLNFVYIDALHTYDDTREILEAFLPKVRRGGALCGHDHTEEYPGVVDAVRDVLGREIEVRRRSFVWIKK